MFYIHISPPKVFLFNSNTCLKNTFCQFTTKGKVKMSEINFQIRAKKSSCKKRPTTQKNHGCLKTKHTMVSTDLTKRQIELIPDQYKNAAPKASQDKFPVNAKSMT
ncbi:hypothetical protein D3Z58_11235 [Clostridiaceae bacterium]|nr:hypothetical protein [Clostridiaceae bacterium]